MKIDLLDYDQLPDDIKMSVPDNGPGREWANYLRVDFGDGRIEYYSDAMESEDAKFCRDLRWVADVVMRAYEAGRRQGKTK